MAANIERFHAVQVPPAEQWVEVEPGIEVGRVWRGLDRVAAYVPGGTAAYPSSLLMSAIPARLAGVGALRRGQPGGGRRALSPALLGAAGLMEVDEFCVMGGAQAIGALAYGTESIAPVDKIVGPGNAWVTAAKLEVLDRCAIDMPAGPTEVMVVADDSADPAHVAADLLSQAEHGPDSPALLVTPSARWPTRSRLELARQLPTLPASRHRSRRRSRRPGRSCIAADLDEALAFADEYAPEHLSVLVARRRGRAAPPPPRGLGVPGRLRARIGRRLRDRLQPRPADRRRRARLRRRCRSRRSGAGCRSQRVTRDGLAPSCRPSPRSPRPRA